MNEIIHQESKVLIKWVWWRVGLLLVILPSSKKSLALQSFNFHFLKNSLHALPVYQLYIFKKVSENWEIKLKLVECEYQGDRRWWFWRFLTSYERGRENWFFFCVKFSSFLKFLSLSERLSLTQKSIVKIFNPHPPSTFHCIREKCCRRISMKIS